MVVFRIRERGKLHHRLIYFYVGQFHFLMGFMYKCYFGQFDGVIYHKNWPGIEKIAAARQHNVSVAQKLVTGPGLSDAGFEMIEGLRLSSMAYCALMS